MSQRDRKTATRFATAAVPAAILSAVWVGAFAGAAKADTFTWNGNTGNLSDPTQWAGGVAPTGLSPNDTLVFGGASTYTATNDIAATATRGAFYFGSLQLTGSAGGSVLVGSSATFPAQTMLRATSSGTTIEQTGSGTFQVAQPISVANSATLTVNVAPGAGSLYLANLTNPTTLAANNFFGAGTVTINNQSASPVYIGDLGGFPGAFNVAAGVVNAGDSTTTSTPGGAGTGGGDLLHNLTVLNVAAGATFNFNGNAETMGGISGAGTIQLGPTGGMTLNYPTDLTWAGAITHPSGGTGGVTKAIGSGATTYTFSGNNSNGGATSVNAGTLRLTGAGQLSATTAVNIATGASLILDNSATNINDRVKSGATLTAMSGNITLIGGAGVNSTQTFGATTVGNSSGESSFRVVNGAAGTATITLASLGRAARGGFVNFSGDGSVVIASPPALVNGVIGYASVNYTDWATVDGTNKVVPLASYQTANDPVTWATTDNVKVTGPLTGSVAAAGEQQVNSLLVASPDTLTLSNGLKVGTGGILATSSATINGGSIYGAQASNTDTVFVIADGATLTVNSNLINNGATATGVTKVGPGKLVLGGTNTFTSSLRLMNGTLSVGSAAALATAGSLTLNGGTLEFTADATVSRRVDINAVNAVLDTGPNNVTFTGTFGGTIATDNSLNFDGSLTKRGAGTLTLATSATANSGRFLTTGNLTIEQGTVRTGSGDTFDTGTLITVASGAVLDLSFDTSGESLGAIGGAGDVYAPGDVSWSGGGFLPVTFAGRIMPYTNGVASAAVNSISKASAGSLTLSGASTYTGTTSVTNGTLILGADALPATNGPFGNATSAVLVGATGANNTGNAALYIGAGGVTLGRDVTIQANATAFVPATIGTTHTSGTSTFSGAISLGRATELDVAAGGTTRLTGVVSGSGSLTKIGGGTAVLTNANTHYGGTIVTAGTLSVTEPAAIGTGPVVINGGTLSAAAGMTGPLAPSSLAISGAGTLDLNDNDMIVEYTGSSPIASVRAAVVAARNGGAWNQPGITSTSAKNIVGGTTTLAVVEASDLGAATFDSVPVDATAVLVKYTYYGDLNLDGKINPDDYALIDRGRAKGLSGWVNGDVNYDGAINSADYLLMDNAFGHQTGVLSPAFLAMREAEFGSDYVAALVASVPEPTSLAACGLALPLLARRRRA